MVRNLNLIIYGISNIKSNTTEKNVCRLNKTTQICYLASIAGMTVDVKWGQKCHKLFLVPAPKKDVFQTEGDRHC